MIQILELAYYWLAGVKSNPLQILTGHLSATISIAPRNRTSSYGENGEQYPDGIDDHLAEFQWRRKNSPNLWDGFIDALKTRQS
ncbi:hypothetical protein HZS_184 [Henneguya salminicola]|nr:hypothetical protein HZS_184 [Henneguya salminicola]